MILLLTIPPPQLAGMPGDVHPGLAAGQHSPVCLASDPVCCYKGHFFSLVKSVAQPGVSAGLVGEDGEKELHCQSVP